MDAATQTVVEEGGNAALLQLQRLASLGLLSSSLAHEFNNFFTTIINTAQLLAADEPDERRRRSLERILRSARRAAELSKAILGYARGDGHDAEHSCDAAAVLDDVMLLVRKELQKHGVRAEVDVAPCPPVSASAAALQQILLNLVLNACQAMPDGGTVRVAVRPLRGRRTVELVVEDTGVGIPKEKLRRVFDPFFSTKTGSTSGRSGTGLGLAVCRELVLAAGGRIRVESKLGVGTRFIIRLPALPNGERRVA